MNRFASGRQHAIAADVIGIGAGVDDEADRPRCEPSDRGEQRLGSVRAAGIGHNDSVPPDVHGDVAAGPGDHVEVRLDLEDGERAVALGRPLRGAYRRTRDLAHDDGRTQSRQPSVRADSGAEAPTHDAHVRTSSSLFRTSATHSIPKFARVEHLLAVENGDVRLGIIGRSTLRRASFYPWRNRGGRHRRHAILGPWRPLPESGPSERLTSPASTKTLYALRQLSLRLFADSLHSWCPSLSRCSTRFGSLPGHAPRCTWK